MKNHLISYCGLYCGACSFKVAFETKDREHINKMPSHYDEYKNNELFDCSGCRLDNNPSECKIKNCAIEKQVAWCSQCNKYPCSIINDFCHDGRPHHEEIIKNLEILNKLGEEEWIKEMKMDWECTKCGKKKSWYNKKCNCE
jgi:hypothetical protein